MKRRSTTSANTILKGTKSKRRFPIALIEEHFKVGERPVKFMIFKPEAKEVFLAGTFNNWDRAPMVRVQSGAWEIQVSLDAGTYEYRFIIDGIWREDPMSERFSANPYGGLNSVIVVKD